MLFSSPRGNHIVMIIRSGVERTSTDLLLKLYVLGISKIGIH